MQNKPYTEKADVYSVGVIYWELLTREKYFGHINFMSLIEDKAPFSSPLTHWLALRLGPLLRRT